MLCGLFIFITYLPSRSDLFDAKIYGSRIGYLHLAYIIIAAFGICPTIHWISLHGGSSNSHVMVSLHDFRCRPNILQKITGSKE